MNRLDPLDTAAWPFGGRPPATAQPVHHCCPALAEADVSKGRGVTNTANHPASVLEVTFADLLCQHFRSLFCLIQLVDHEDSPRIGFLGQPQATGWRTELIIQGPPGLPGVGKLEWLN